MAIDKIDVTGDPRIERRTAQINGKIYGERTQDKIPTI